MFENPAATGSGSDSQYLPRSDPAGFRFMITWRVFMLFSFLGTSDYLRAQRPSLMTSWHKLQQGLWCLHGMLCSVVGTESKSQIHYFIALYPFIGHTPLLPAIMNLITASTSQDCCGRV